jgi:outer membrane protein assembly factor BamB
MNRRAIAAASHRSVSGGNMYRTGRGRRFRTLFAVGLTALCTAALAADWPQWRGPLRTGVSNETGLLKKWPEGGPKLLWTGNNLGEAHATPAIAKGRVYGMGLRGDDEVVWALDDKDGKEIWAQKIAGRIRLGGQQGGNGPRCTPTVDGSRLYVLGVGGELACLEAGDGKIVWHKSLTDTYDAQVPQWGYSESPLVDGNKVIAAPGGRKGTIVAFDKNTGSQIWVCNTSRDSAHYSSAIAADVDGKRQIIHFLSGGVVGVNAQDGTVLWRYDAPANNVANCSTPIYKDGYVFAATSYNTGGGLAKVSDKSAEQVYFTKSMMNKHGGMVLVGDYIYGFSDAGRVLTCLEFKTGKVMWENPTFGATGSITCADGNLIVRSESGRSSAIGLVEATPTGYVEKGRFMQPEQSGSPAWPYPVVANGKLYIRDMNKLFVYDLKQTTAQK